MSMKLKQFAGLTNGQLREELMSREIVFYDPKKMPRWGGLVWSAGITHSRPGAKYVYAEKCVTFTKAGKPRKNSVKNRENFVIPEGWWYSEGMTPIMEEPLEISGEVLLQAEIDAKLKEYVERRIVELTYYGNQKSSNGNGLTVNNVQTWHMGEAFVTIFKELTE